MIAAPHGGRRVLTSEASAMDPENDRPEVLCRPDPWDVGGLYVEKHAVLAAAAVLQALGAGQLGGNDRTVPGVDLGVSEAAGKLSIAYAGEPEGLLVAEALVGVA